MAPQRIPTLLIACLPLAITPACARAAPVVNQLDPLGGQQGTVVEVEVRGSALDGVFAAWLGGDTRLDPLEDPCPGQAGRTTRNGAGLQASIAAVNGGSLVRVKLAIARDARAGAHTLHLVSPSGLSNGLSFWVVPHAAIRETSEPHSTPDQAQPITPPVAVSGRIPEQGRLGWYRIDVAGEQTLTFEVLSYRGAGFDPRVILYETAGSWFDPHRANRLLFREEETRGSMPPDRRLTYHFSRPGRYLVQVGSIFARGGPDFAYLLRIIPSDPDPPAARDGPLDWTQRRLDTIRSRTVEAPPAPPLHLVAEQEPDDPSHRARLSLPAVLEGTIGQPGDIDSFSFQSSPGQRLAFEVDTPRAQPPQFVPRLDVLDASGTVVSSNLEVRDGAIRRVARKVVATLETGGEYRLRVRDVTSVHGGPDHEYRVLVRALVPHVGDVAVRGDGPINLAPGATRRLTVSAPLEEGYTGEFAVSVEGLPGGVQALFSTSGSALTLVADADAPPTPMPRTIRISGRPIVAGKVGPSRAVRELAVMVVKP
jgi:hypothetical protein